VLSDRLECLDALRHLIAGASLGLLSRCPVSCHYTSGPVRDRRREEAMSEEASNFDLHTFFRLLQNFASYQEQKTVPSLAEFLCYFQCLFLCRCVYDASILRTNARACSLIHLLFFQNVADPRGLKRLQSR